MKFVKRICLLTLLMLSALFVFAAASATQNAMWIMDDLNITQVPGGDYSHAGTYNFDIVGVNNLNIKAPFDCQVVARFTSYDSGNTVIVQSLAPVQFANGTLDYMSMAFAHDNDISDCYMGRTYRQGEVIGQNGNYGVATGIHSHVTVILGRYTDHPGWTQVSTGNWSFHYAMHPVDALFISESTNIYNTMGLNFKKVVTNGTLNVGIQLDGSQNAENASCGTFDVYIDNALVADNVSSYSQAWALGKSYTVTDIRPVGNYTYDGEESYSGTISTSTVNVALPFSSYGMLVVDGKVDGQSVTDIEGFGTFDVFIDGELEAGGVTQFSGSWSKGTSYSIENVIAGKDSFFDGAVSGALSGTISAGTTFKVTLAFSTRIEPTAEWQEVYVLPGNITAELCDIEYYHTYSATAPESPGEGWTAVGEPIITYEKSGGEYESDFDLGDSDTRRRLHYYYYHFCGPNAGNNANFAYSGNFVHWDSINANDVYVDNSGQDSDDPRYTYYRLKWHDGSWAYCQSGVTCDGSNGSHGARTYAWYRRYIYQDYIKVTNYEWIKESGWVKEFDPAADTVKYRFRLKDTVAPVIDDAKIAAITPDGYVVAFSASDNSGLASVSVGIWPDGESVDNAFWKDCKPETAGSDVYAADIQLTDFDGSQNCLYHTAIHVRDLSGNEMIYSDDSIAVLVPKLVRTGKKIVLPAGLKVIDGEVFSGAATVSEVLIPDGVQNIGGAAFADCTNLSIVHVPDSVKVIADDAFENCGRLVMICSMDSAAAEYAKDHSIAYITSE